MKSKNIYPRPRIYRLLHETLACRLTAVVAGAGYGKTAAAHEFLKIIGVPYAWVTLTDGDADVFWDKLCAVVEQVRAKAADDLRILGLPVGAWPIAQVVKLARKYCRRPFIICIDDYQHLPEDSPVHALIETLAFENMENLHILLLSRVQPAISLGTLISKEMALCIDADDLRFDREETGGYLAMRGLRLSTDAVERIHDNAAGWIAAIYLMSEGVRAGGNIKKSAIDTLFSESLMAQLGELDRDMLCRLSAFASFPLDMAAYAFASGRLRQLIAKMVRENAFITEDTNGEYRFHPLLRDYLAARCPDDERQKNIYRRAGLWYVKRTDYRYSYSVELFIRAACAEEYLQLHNHPGARRMNYYDMDAICRMVTALPDDFCLKYPFPYLQIVFYLLLSGKSLYLRFAGRLLNRMREYFSSQGTEELPQRNIILGELIVISRVTGFGQLEGDGEPLEQAAMLLGGRPSELLNPNDPFTFGLPMLLHSEYMRAGTLSETVERCQHNAYELVTDGFGRGSECLARAEAALLRCDMDEAKRMAEIALQEAKEKQQYFIMASGYFVLMRRSLHLGDCGQAVFLLNNIRELIPAAAKNLCEKRITINALREAARLSEFFFSIMILQLEDIPADFLEGAYKSTMTTGLGVPQMLMAKAMLLRGNPVGALRMCARQKEMTNVCQCARLTGYILSALASEALYGGHRGLAPLKQALVEAQPDGVVLPFAENPALLPLMKRLQQNEIDGSFLIKLQRACEAYQNIAPQGKAKKKERLSQREKEVLGLMAAGMSRKEAANTLSVTEDTIKKHLSAVYKKLAAKNKIEAIAIARMKRLL